MTVQSTYAPSTIIGNRASGQWQQGWPLENVHVAAERIGRWLRGWTPLVATEPPPCVHRPLDHGDAWVMDGAMPQDRERRVERERVARRPVSPERVRLEVIDARVSGADACERAVVAYATFANEGKATATVVALESSAFERIEVHEPLREGETATRKIDSFVIPDHDSVDFAPGGRHLRLIGPRRALREAQLIGITVTFSSGVERLVPFRVTEAIPLR